MAFFGYLGASRLHRSDSCTHYHPILPPSLCNVSLAYNSRTGPECDRSRTFLASRRPELSLTFSCHVTRFPRKPLAFTIQDSQSHGGVPCRPCRRRQDRIRVRIQQPWGGPPKTHFWGSSPAIVDWEFRRRQRCGRRISREEVARRQGMGRDGGFNAPAIVEGAAAAVEVEGAQVGSERQKERPVISTHRSQIWRRRPRGRASCSC